MAPSGTGTPCVAAVVLAAGGSARMGRAKLLLPVDGLPMVRRVTETVCAAGLTQVVVVVGAHAPRIVRALHGLPVEIARNDRWAEGMSTSLREGLHALRPDVQAALVVLADQPGLSVGLLHALTARYEATHSSIVVPSYRGRRGNPVLWDRAFFRDLAAVQGDRGGRDILSLNEKLIERVAVEDPAVIQDLDTPEDYEAAQTAEPAR